MRSLRYRLLVGVTAGTALLLVLFSVGVYAMMRRALVGEFDTSLVATARTLAAAVELDKGEIEIELDLRTLPEFQLHDNADYFQLSRSEGDIVLRSPSLAKAEMPRFFGTLEKPEIRRTVLPNGRPGRAVGIRFAPRDDGAGGQGNDAAGTEVVLVVARSSLGLAAELRLLRWVLVGSGAAVMLLSLLVAALVVRRGLRPLGELAARIASMRPEHLKDRVPAAPMPSEMVPVAEKLNDFLVRLEGAFNRERALTADVAHELRTPLGGVIATIEVALSRAREQGEYREALCDCLEIAKGMQLMVNSLLSLARLESGQEKPKWEQTNLLDLVEGCWRPLAAGAAKRSITFENELPANLACITARAILSVILQNLLENAAEYADDGGRIWVAGGAGATSVELTVSNTGAHLSRADIANVFNPFWRGDSSRRDAGLRCGLGLTLVQRLAGVLGGTARASLAGFGIFAVTVTIPAR